MSSITSLTLAPFAMFFRLCHEHAWPAMVLSVIAAVGAEVLGYDTWATTLVCFGAYLLIHIEERDRAPEQGSHQEQA